MTAFCNARGLTYGTFKKFFNKDPKKRITLQPFTSTSQGGQFKLISKADYEMLALNNMDTPISQLTTVVGAAHPHLAKQQKGSVVQNLKALIEKKKARATALTAAVEASVAAAASSRQQQVQVPSVAAASGAVDSNEEVPPLPALPPLPTMPTIPDEWF